MEVMPTSDESSDIVIHVIISVVCRTRLGISSEASGYKMDSLISLQNASKRMHQKNPYQV